MNEVPFPNLTDFSTTTISNICPSTCTQQTYYSISKLGILFGIMGLVMLLLYLNSHRKFLIVLQIIFFLLFILYIFQYKFIGCGSGCEASGVFYEFNFFPHGIIPFTW